MTQRVAVVGGGPAGLTAAIYTARAGLQTTVYDAGEPILARNAHLENVPGFPAGVNARTFLENTREQADRAGVEFVDARVEHVERDNDGRFVVDTDAGASGAADFVVAASWPDSSYLEAFELERIDRGSKTMLSTDEFARTDVEGLYAAGRLARQYHQAVVAAGHGATAGLTVVDDSDVAYYHDWVAPDGYFTGRGRELPPGCEEIEETERRERERESLSALRALSPADSPTQHPSVDD
ncbi:NAD(P)/FAD-dependent oxidoreductase [Halobacterium bonnevillei]|uniref:FAD-dependent oxidoreductase n=1 Tax=Halobacterium bonnevillei TaxID=2692200 RepID=A0A6B0STK9_9EURY|nr:NAD(P)/FAD-dependent oxidoreductase [Halobacterium bonnevillei]MXR20909.1 FAD-dependent oxidoreductase [Halobacterium bonnevillei]